LDPNVLKRICNVKQFINADKYFPSYNVCPNNFIPVLLLQEKLLKYYKDQKTDDQEKNNATTQEQTAPATSERVLSTMRWGLVPSFSKDGKTTNSFKTINARQDTVKEKPMYRRLVNSKRCVVVFNGYYEWQTAKNTKQKQPYYFTPEYVEADSNHNRNITADIKPERKEQTEEEEMPVMYMAALWDCWRDPKDEKNLLFTVTILTTDARPDVRFCHHRMPLIMTRECVDKWINTDEYSIDECFEDIANSQQFIRVQSHAVPRDKVGNTKNKSKECIQTLQEFEAAKKQTGLHKFFQTAPKSTTKKEIETVKPETDGAENTKQESAVTVDDSHNNSNQANTNVHNADAGNASEPEKNENVQVQQQQSENPDDEEDNGLLAEMDEEFEFADLLVADEEENVGGMDQDEEDDVARAIRESMRTFEQEQQQRSGDEMKVDTDTEQEVDVDDDEQEIMEDEELQRAIEESQKAYNEEQVKRGKKRKVNEIDDADADEAQVHEEKSPAKRRKLNSGSAKNSNAGGKGRKTRKK